MQILKPKIIRTTSFVRSDIERKTSHTRDLIDGYFKLCIDENHRLNIFIIITYGPNKTSINSEQCKRFYIKLNINCMFSLDNNVFIYYAERKKQPLFLYLEKTN